MTSINLSFLVLIAQAFIQISFTPIHEDIINTILFSVYIVALAISEKNIKAQARSMRAKK